MSVGIDHAVASCSGTCKVTVTAVLPLTSGQLSLKDFKASLLHNTEDQAATDADDKELSEVTAGSGEATFVKLKANDYRVKIALTDDQKKRVTADSVLMKSQKVEADEKTGLFIFTLTSLPSLKVQLFEDKDKKTKVAGIKVTAKPAGNALAQTTDKDKDGIADFGWVAAGDYELSLELTEEQKRRFRQIAKTTVKLANNDEKLEQIVLAPVATLTVKLSRQDKLKRLGNVTVKVLEDGANKNDAKVEVKSTELDPDTTEVTYGDLDPGSYTITVAAKDNDEKTFRIGRTIARTDAALKAVAPDGQERDEKVAVPGQQVTTVSIVLAPPYKKVQFVGYYLYTSTYVGSDDPAGFGNDPMKAAEDDIAKRCKIVVDAIKEAESNAEIKKDSDVLKIFMAPEFYFRGKQGAYPLEAIAGREKTSGILPALQAETLKDAYKDWLFVFGTAVGYQDVEKKKAVEYAVNVFTIEETDIIVYCETSDAAAAADSNWESFLYTPPGSSTATEVPLVGADDCEPIKAPAYKFLKVQVNDLTFPRGSQLQLLEDANSSPQDVDIWADKTYDINFKCRAAVPRPGWALRQGDVVGSILAVTNKGSGEYNCEIAVSTEKRFDDSKSAKLVDPGETEIFNIALLQKGGPALPAAADGGRALKEALVYKEVVSQVDFEGPAFAIGMEGGFENVLRHLINVHGNVVRAIPTEGSTDVLSKKQNAPAFGSSEVNRSGLGGGSILTIDGIDFGIEVCLDHARRRLFDYYSKRLAKAGEPLIQVHLIPSAGVSITSYCCVAKGYVFNVDKVHCAAQQHDRGTTKDLAVRSVKAITSTGGLTMSDHFKTTTRIENPDRAAATKKMESKNGYVVVYEAAVLPGRATF